MRALSSLVIPARPNDNNDGCGGGCSGLQPWWCGFPEEQSRAELMVPQTTQVLPQRPSKSAGLLCLFALLWVCPGVSAWEGALRLPGSMRDHGHVSGMLWGGLAWLLISFLPACRLGVLGLPRGLLYFPLGVPPGEEICLGLGDVWLASGNVRKVFYFLFPPPKISSPLEAQGQGGNTSACLVRRTFASELFSQQCPIKGSLCLGWDKGTSLIKLA